MKKINYHISNKTNALLTLLVLSINIFQFFILPLYLLPQNILWVVTIILLIPFNNMMWFLIHEAIHKNLFSNKIINDIGGRILSVVFGAGFQLLCFGHLMHHKLNRYWESELYERPSIRAKTKYYFKILCGLYFTEVFSTLLLFSFSRKNIARIAARTDKHNGQTSKQIDIFFYERTRINKLRTEFFGSIIFYTASAMAFGRFWPVLVGIIILRAIAISLMDNAFHYDTPLDNSVPGKHLKAGRIAEFFLLNGNFHGLHHKNPTIPWQRLPEEFMKNELNTEGNFLNHLFRQFEGPRYNS